MAEYKGKHLIRIWLAGKCLLKIKVDTILSKLVKCINKNLRVQVKGQNK